MVTLMLLINFLQKMRLVLYRLLLQMNKLVNTNKLKKHFKKGITPLLCSLTIFNICFINVAATSYVCHIPYVEPSIPDHGGYVLANLSNEYGNSNTMFYLAFYPYDDNNGHSGGGSSAPVQPYFEYISTSVYVTDVGITFRVNAIQRGDAPYHVTGYIVLYRVYYDGEIRVINSAYHNLIDDGAWQWTTSQNLGTINAVNIVGNFTFIQNNLTSYNSLDVVWGDQKEFYDLLSGINSAMSNVNINLNTTNQKLTDIYNRLGLLLDQQPDGNITDVSNSGITNVTNKEQELLDKTDSVSNDINNLQVDINPNAASVTWDLVNTAVMSNTKVFTMFLSILTIGIIGLILNR